MTDWNPSLYSRFAGLRLRPALDLLAQVGALPDGDAVDLGCGNGAAGPALRARLPGRHLIGLDASPAMLDGAQRTGAYDALIEADAGGWHPVRTPALIFSNALLHWLPDHAALFPRLAGCLAPGGVLAVQMPRQFDAPSHRLIREVSARLFPDRFDWSGWQAPVAEPQVYHRLLAPLGAVSVWETEYLQTLAPVPTGHPVRQFTQSTIMRPVLERLSDAEAADFIAAYDAALAPPYPAQTDGTVIFPFRRLFMVLRRP
ncbi:methyltransferase domain-containing protein [Anianabacter salinae]|uniref:methyltransferase domain-containing protein n=1 Tax=Anianabacter salinae TaxID=2851023 RepID=UPI00225DE20C|nr:methyltransferase domain-containing protein [Anianabacter salinae]MBV0911266.1 methyltransferase domain-containing protein [Anianabacter salinae]